jgi:hypothetical protein
MDRMSRLIVAALVLLVTVGGLFGAAAWNRGGDVQAIVLSERELALPWGWPSDRLDARLRLQWQRRDEPQDARVWLTDVKLRELGFTTGVPAGAPEAELFYGRSLPRLAWVAFELNGPAWHLIEQRRSMVAPPDPANPTRSFDRPQDWSRLVPVDAAVAPEPLRRRYAHAPVIVLPAVVRMRFRTTRAEGPSVWAEVESLVSPDVSIPARLRGRLPRAAIESNRPARYEVDFRVGRLGGAWVEDVRPLGQ